MKTNHRRGFKETRTSHDVFAHYLVISLCRQALDGEFVSASANSGDHCCGKRGIRRDRAGAKKFVNSRVRRRDRDELKRRVNQDE